MVTPDYAHRAGKFSTKRRAEPRARKRKSANRSGSSSGGSGFIRFCLKGILIVVSISAIVYGIRLLYSSYPDIKNRVAVEIPAKIEAAKTEAAKAKSAKVETAKAEPVKAKPVEAKPVESKPTKKESLPPVVEAVPAAVPSQQEVEPEAAAVIEETPQVVEPSEPRFSFYHILPELEVEVSDLSEDYAVENDPNVIFILQVAAFQKYSDAEDLKNRIVALDFHSDVQTVVGQNGEWHRVRAGPFETSRDAARARRRLQTHSIESMVLRTTKPKTEVEAEVKAEAEVKIEPKTE